MNEQFVTYEIASEFKKLGFNEPCLGHYEDNIEIFTHKPIKGKLNLGFLGQCKSEPYDWNNAPKWGTKSQIFYSAPLWQQVIDWLSYNHQITIRPALYNDNYEVHKIEWDEDSILTFNNKEQAILKAIELCQKEK